MRRWHCKINFFFFFSYKYGVVGYIETNSIYYLLESWEHSSWPIFCKKRYFTSEVLFIFFALFVDTYRNIWNKNLVSIYPSVNFAILFFMLHWILFVEKLNIRIVIYGLMGRGTVRRLIDSCRKYFMKFKSVLHEFKMKEGRDE